MSPELVRLKPTTIAVLPVRNETVLPLDSVSFGGLAQRIVIGVQSYDVLQLLRGALEETVLQRGYALGTASDGAADVTTPLPEGSAPPPYDAALVATIESWAANTGAAMSMRYRLEIHRVPTAEVLYSGTFTCGYREDGHSRSGEALTSVIRRSAHRALADLPPAKG